MKNKELRETINKVQSGEHGVKIDRLSMALSGILDAAVNGGTAKYQEAFLTKEYSMHHKDKASQDFISHLKITLLDQLEIVSYGLYVHHDLCSTSLEGFHSHLEGMCFNVGIVNSIYVSSSSIQKNGQTNERYDSRAC